MKQRKRREEEEGGRKRASGGSGAARCGREEKPSLFNSTQLSTDIFSQHANCLPSLEHNVFKCFSLVFGIPKHKALLILLSAQSNSFHLILYGNISHIIYRPFANVFFCTKKTAPTMIIVQQPLVNSLPCPLACVRTA